MAHHSNQRRRRYALLLVVATCAVIASPGNSAARDELTRVAAVGSDRTASWTGQQLTLRSLQGKILKKASLAPVDILDVIPGVGGNAFVLGVVTTEMAGGGSTSNYSVQRIDGMGTSKAQWSIAEPARGLVVEQYPIVLTLKSLMRLNDDGSQTVLMANQGRETQLLLDQHQRPVLCRQLDRRNVLAGTNTSAACRGHAGLNFEGVWHSVEPLICGAWLVEPVQQRDSQGTVALQVRSTKDGSVMQRLDYKSGAIACLGSNAVFDISNQTRLGLPNLDQPTKMTCAAPRAPPYWPVAPVAQRPPV